LGEFALELQREWREERDAAIAPLKAEIAELKGKLDAVAELKGKVDALLTLLQGAKADVIGLPRKRPPHAAVDVPAISPGLAAPRPTVARRIDSKRELAAGRGSRIAQGARGRSR